jgi:hypothetical protein
MSNRVKHLVAVVVGVIFVGCSPSPKSTNDTTTISKEKHKEILTIQPREVKTEK